MITEEEVEKAIDYLRDTAVDAAQARADRIYLEEYRKSLKAMIMSEFAGLAIGAQGGKRIVINGMSITLTL